MKKLIAFALVGLMASVALTGCGSSSEDGGDPTKAPRVQEVKKPEGWESPETAIGKKHAAAKEKMKETSEGDADGGK